MWVKYLEPGKRGAAWYIRGRDRTGRFEVSTGAQTRSGAEAFAERFLADRARDRVPGRGEAVGFDKAAQHYKLARPHLSKAEVRAVDALALHIGDMDCRLVNHAVLVDAANALQPGRANSTKNRKVISPAAAVLHYAAAQDWCDDRRFPKFAESRKSSRQAATDETVALLIANAEAPPRTSPQGRRKDHQLPYKKLLLAMLYELGLRISDTLRIERENIDLGAGRVRVRISKTDEYASLAISPAIVAMIANLPGTGRLFPWSTTRGVYGWLTPLTKRLGVTYTPHMSRHALATAAGEAMLPDKKAAELGVWRDPRSLHRYQHVRPDAIPGRSAGALMGRKK